MAIHEVVCASSSAKKNPVALRPLRKKLVCRATPNPEDISAFYSFPVMSFNLASKTGRASKKSETKDPKALILMEKMKNWNHEKENESKSKDKKT